MQVGDLNEYPIECVYFVVSLIPRLHGSREEPGYEANFVVCMFHYSN